MYYQLFVLEDGQFVAEFGDKDKELVMFEKQCYQDSGIRAKHIKLVTFKRTPTTNQLLAKLAELNK